MNRRVINGQYTVYNTYGNSHNTVHLLGENNLKFSTSPFQ